MDLLIAYENPVELESDLTADFIAEILLEHIPESHEWISQPNENDPTGSHWSPAWFSIATAMKVIESRLNTLESSPIIVPGFAPDEVEDELRLFLNELQRATEGTNNFHVSVY